MDNEINTLDHMTDQVTLLLHSVTDYAIYMLDLQGRVRSWNTGGERIKGYTANEVIGRHFSRFYTAEDIAVGMPEQGLGTAAREGRFEAEGWRVRKDGSRFRASVVIDPVHEDGRLVGYAKVTRDITERWEAEQELEQARKALFESQKMESIGKLTLGLAHDFNNLLGIVINSVELIGSRPGADARTRELVEIAMRSCDRGALLTRQLLAFGRGQRLAPEQCDLNAILQGSEELYRRACGNDVELDLVLVPELPRVNVDCAQFEAGVLNLIVNSRDAIPGGGRIVIRTWAGPMRNPAERASPEREHVVVEVTDDGEGIDPAHQQQVFDPFYTTKEVGKGSGLGLSQVFGFAGQSGGFITLDSTPGHGTTVRMCLPVYEDTR